MLKALILAFKSYYKAHQLIQKHKLWKWIVLPGILYALLFGVSMYFFGSSASSFIGWIWRITSLDKWLAAVDSGILSFLFTLTGVMLWLVLMLFYFSLFKYVWLIIGSPVFAYLSEKTEAIIDGKTHTFSWQQLWKDVFRGIQIALRNTLWQTVYTFSILLLSFMPLVGWITPLLALLIECYYYGFSMLDYSCERKKMTAEESIFFIGRNKGLAIGNGIIFYLMHLIPVIGWLLAPAYAVIAATVSLNPTPTTQKKYHVTV
ncbi:MAG: EI24 domain-containing protein [Chitinophagaceae bacterium]